MKLTSLPSIPRAVLSLLLAGLLCSMHTHVHAENVSTSSWLALQQGNAIAIMRHALAPGVGDPSNFALGDCSTQRNLSEGGRTQSTNIAQTLDDNGLSSADIFSSGWCRCLETARLLSLGPVERLPSLDSFFQDRSTAESQTEQLKAWIASRLSNQQNKPAILVTHQVNISALTGRGVSSGEIFFITLVDGEIQVLDTLLQAP